MRPTGFTVIVGNVPSMVTVTGAVYTEYGAPSTRYDVFRTPSPVSFTVKVTVTVDSHHELCPKVPPIEAVVKGAVVSGRKRPVTTCWGATEADAFFVNRTTVFPMPGSMVTSWIDNE